MVTMRYAGSTTRARLQRAELVCRPLPPTHYSGGIWRATIDLPAISAGALLVPGFASLLNASSRYRLVLATDRHRWELPWCGGRGGLIRSRRTILHPAVRPEVDGWQVCEALAQPRLILESAVPLDATALLVVSVRPRHLTDIALPAKLVDSRLPVAGISQLTLDVEHPRAICSPTAMTMALSAVGIAPEPVIMARECHDPTHRIYGIWPQAIAAAARRGILACVELFDELDEPLRWVAGGQPLVCSINYGRDTLPGAALTATAGHLVALTGVEAGTICIADPAAASNDTVHRRVEPAAFAQAWLGARGAGYRLFRPD